MNEKRYTIHELKDLTGFSARNIRYYITEELLPRPAGRGRGGFYYDSHMAILMEIKALKDRGLGLAAIKELLKQKPPADTSLDRDVWIRITMAPGLELHVSRALEGTAQKKIMETIRISKILFTKGKTGSE